MIPNLSDLPIDFTNLWRICEEFVVLHHDVQPILFSGRNHYQNRILGSLLFDDDENETTYYLYSIVSEEDYSRLITLRASYRSVLDNSGFTYVVQKDFDGRSEKAFAVRLDSLPENILPTSESFLISPLVPQSSTYTVHAHGNEDTAHHRVLPSTAQTIITNVTSMLMSDFSPVLEQASSKPFVRLLPPKAGSYEFVFQVVLKDTTGHLFVSDNALREVISANLGYMFSGIYQEYMHLYNPNLHERPELYDSIYTLTIDRLGIKEGRDDTDVIDALLRKQYKRMASRVSNIAEALMDEGIVAELKNDNIVLGSFSKENMDAQINLSHNIQVTSEDIVEDTTYKSFVIHVFNLNLNSRKGSAYTQKQESPEEKWAPKIFVEPGEPLDHTKFTESLHLNKDIEVQAKATTRKRDGKILKLVIRPD